jgi:hypothetical protein
MNDQSYWQWCTHGLGGVINMLIKCSQEGGTCSEHYLGVLKECRSDLDMLIAAEEKKPR